MSARIITLQNTHNLLQTICSKHLPLLGAYNVVTTCTEYRNPQNGQARCINSGSTPPTQAEIIVCGGGVVGASVAYHLAKLGWKDIVLLEQGSLSCGSTWHAAGLIGKLRSTSSGTQLSDYGCELYSKLEQETGLGTGFKKCGGLIVARTKERMSLLKRRADLARVFNINAEIVSPKEAEDLWTVGLHSDDILGGLWIPDEGVANPTDICQSLARGAVLNGVQIYEKVCVESISTSNGRVCGIDTNKGAMKCDIFVNCGGQWAREIGQKSTPKVNIPLHSCEHFYVVTKPFGAPGMLPALRDPDGRIYIREWSGGFMCGGFEMRSKPCFHEGIPGNFEFQLLPEDWPHFEELFVEFLHRVPSLEKAEIRQMINGPESFTPDLNYCLGPVHEMANYYVAAGMSSSGICNAAGVGKVLSEWITDGKPSIDLSSMDIRRFSPHHNNKMFLRDRVTETLGTHVSVMYPYSEWNSSRNVKCSAIHSRLDSAGAVWGEANGWERANWFQVPGEARPSDNGFGRPDWFKNVQTEYNACQEGVGLVDMTSLGMLEISSPKPGACEDFLQFLCAKDISHVTSLAGRVVNTAMLNHRGGFEGVCSVLRTDDNKYLLLLPTAEHTTLAQAWINRHIPEHSAIQIRNVQSSHVSLALLGPRSSQLLQSLTQTSLDESQFAVDTFKEVDLGYAVGVKLVRRSDNVDAVNWQLFVPVEYALNLYDQLMEAGADLGIRNVGQYAVKCVRVEQARPAYGSELTPSTTTHDVGLHGDVDVDKDVDFLGKQAVVEMSDGPRHKRLVHMTLLQHDEDELPWGGEPVVRDGSVVGTTSSASYSFKLDQPVCLGFIQGDRVDEAFIRDGTFEIIVAGKSYPLKVSFPNL